MMKLLIDNAIDTVQSSKKMFVDTFVKHEGLAKTMNEFVDAQTEYTKKAIDVGFETGTKVYKTVANASFYTETAKALQESVKSVFDTEKKGK